MMMLRVMRKVIAEEKNVLRVDGFRHGADLIMQRRQRKKRKRKGGQESNPLPACSKLARVIHPLLWLGGLVQCVTCL